MKNIKEMWILRCRGCGYWSGADYQERILLTKKDKELLEKKIEEGWEFYAFDLDGKHSDVELTPEFYPAEEFVKENYFMVNDGDDVLESIIDVLETRYNTYKEREKEMKGLPWGYKLMNRPISMETYLKIKELGVDLP